MQTNRSAQPPHTDATANTDFSLPLLRPTHGRRDRTGRQARSLPTLQAGRSRPRSGRDTTTESARTAACRACRAHANALAGRASSRACRADNTRTTSTTCRCFTATRTDSCEPVCLRPHATRTATGYGRSARAGEGHAAAAQTRTVAVARTGTTARTGVYVPAARSRRQHPERT